MDRELGWTSGYVTELEYTYGYYRELSPGILRLACLAAGMMPAERKPLQYLELGFGQGMSINIHAASIDGDFWGTDFNPAQVAHARALGEAAGSGVRLFDDSFSEFAARSDLPEFDIIGLHGIWTWVSDENGREIVELIRRRLRAGGIAYLSYNCLPGWAASMPLRHLMKLHVDFAAESVGMRAKLDEAIEFSQHVIDSGALFFRGNPAVAERLKQIAGLDRNYLAHEYFNRDWRVMPFSDVAHQLEGARLSFVASAHLLDHVEDVNLAKRAQDFLSGISNPVLRQSVRDYFVNQQFRRDIFMKGGRRLTGLEQREAFARQAFALLLRAEDVPLNVMGALGEATLHEEVYRPIIEFLAEDSYRPKMIGQLASRPSQVKRGAICTACTKRPGPHWGRVRTSGARTIETGEGEVRRYEPIPLRTRA